MSALHTGLFIALWGAWGAFWLAAALRGGKAVRRREPLPLLVEHGGAIALAGLLLALPRLPGPLGEQVFRPTAAGSWAGFFLLLAGVALGVWARVHLGGNWSGAVTLKVGHQLVRGGPYALVRHPIYTALITGFLGSALARAEWRGVLAVALVAFTHWRKARREERWLGERFGEAYAAYQREVPMLVPGWRPGR